MTQHLVQLITQYGLLIVAANVLVDQIGLPVPAMPTLIVAGAIAATGTSALGSLFLASVIACLLPDCAWFLVGQIYGIRVLKTLCRISLEPDSCVSQTQSRFERWGVNSLVIAKFVPGLAIIAPPLAGAMRIGWPRFIALSAMGGALWVGTGLAAGMLFKTQIQQLLIHLDRIGSITGTVVAAALIGYIVYKWWERARFYKALRMARISVTDLYELIQAGEQPTVVDVRSATARALEPRWIPGRHPCAGGRCGTGTSQSCRGIGRSSSIVRVRAKRRRPASPRCSSITASRKCAPCSAVSTRGSPRATTSRLTGSPGLSESATHHVVIVGGGFGGLAVAQGLKGAGLRITIVDQRNHHLFQPLLYQVGTATLATSEIAWPIRQLFRKRKDITTLARDGRGRRCARREVLLDDGGRLTTTCS